MSDENERYEAEPEEKAEEPQVYSVEKDLTGWKFSRREFLATATAAAAAATAAATAVASAQKSGASSSETTEGIAGSISLAVAMPAVMVVGVGEVIKQIWQITNQSETAWCRGASLHLTGHDQIQTQTSITVPDIAPGETVDIEVDMAALAEPGVYQGNWHLNVIENVVPVSYGAFVLQTGCIAESLHPYANDTDQTWLATNPDINAQRTRVHFSRLEVESDWDYVYIRDGGGNLIQPITGYYPAGVWSMAVPGRDVQVQLVSDSLYDGWGFCLDQVETVQLVYMPIIFKQPTPTPSPTPCTCYGVCTCNPICTCNPVCTCHPIHYWYPN
ncbi:MAG: hypothetical protein JW934_15255 [Anaerolineae bacterium]|nr:hypothetical protein [Anaerolineae bacterium]